MLKLFWSQSFASHYVAEDPAGDRWLIPVTPMSPAAWRLRQPYRGNQTLTRCLASVERFYQPPQEASDGQ